MLTLLKHYLLETHFHAVPHGLASWIDGELESRFQEMQCASQCGRGGTAYLQRDFKAKDFLGNSVAIISKQPVRNSNENLTSGQHGQKNRLVLRQQNGSTQTQTKRNDLTTTTSMGGPVLVLGQHCSTHQSSSHANLGEKMYLQNEFPASFSLNAPLSWQAATDNNFVTLKKKTMAAVPNTWSASGEVENEVAAASSLLLFPNSPVPVCHVGNNMRRSVIGVKRDSSWQDTFVNNAATSVNNTVVDTPSPEPFRSNSGEEIILQSEGDAAATSSIKVQTPSPEPNWSSPTYKRESGRNTVVMDVRTPSPEHHLSINDDDACYNAQETVPQINIPFEADYENPNKLELTPSPIGADTNRTIYHSHQEVLLLPSPESGTIAGEEVCQSRQRLQQCSASHQTDNDNGIKIVATPSPEQQHCNEQERRVIKYNNQVVSLAQSPHFTGRRIIAEKATSPLCSGRHKKRYCSWPSSQNPTFLSLWTREEAQQVKGQEGKQQTPQLLPSNYFYVEQRECISLCGLEVEPHLGKVLELHDNGSKIALYPPSNDCDSLTISPCGLEVEPHLGKVLELHDDGSKAALYPPSNDLDSLTLTPKRINDSIGTDKHPQHMLHGDGDGDSASPLPMDHSYSRKSRSESLALKSALLVSSPESPPPPVNWLTTISNQTKTFHVINNNFSEVRLQPEDIKSSVHIGQVGRKFILVSLLSSVVRTDGLLLCIDQHAADERIQLENLEKSVAEKRESGALKAHIIHPPREFKLMAEGILYRSQCVHVVIIG